MRALYASLMILVLQASYAFPVTAQNDRYERWRIWTEAITDDFLNDARQLPPLRRAELLTRLGHRWWYYDQGRAAGWFGNAIDIVEQAPKNETSDERGQRLETARLMLKFVIIFDEKLSGRLIALLSNKEVSDSEHIVNADGLIEAARTLAQFDPKRGAELGALALRVGPPMQIAGLFNVLHQREPKLADDFLLQALATAKQDSSGLLLNSLTYILFPTPRRFRTNTSPPPTVPTKVLTMHVSKPYISPDNLRLELLQLDIAFLNAGFKGNGIDCGSVLQVIAPVMDEFERLLPQQAAIAHRAVNECGFTRPLPQQPPPQSGSKKRVLDTLALNTVEGLLEAAADIQEIQPRTTLKQNAASLALTNKDYERAFKILDDMSPEERKSMGSWEEIRPHWAAGVAVEHYKNGQIREMNLVLNGVPSELQPLAKIEFLQRSLSVSDPLPIELDLALQFLKDARAALRRSSLPEIKKYDRYFTLMRLVLKYDPPAAGAAFKEAVASLNLAEQTKEPKDLKLLDYGRLASSLPLSLIDMAETAVNEGIASIASVESRAQLRLELLSETLRRTRAPGSP